MKPKVISPLLPQVLKIKKLLRSLDLHTVCEEANCPNIGECFSKKTATFMILGDVCTRNCLYCSVAHGRPLPPDPQEPENLAKAVESLGLKYVVVTSVDRDDLPDGGALQFVKVVQALKSVSEDIKVELLIPDFRGNTQSLKMVVYAKPDVINHNIETVQSLHKKIRPGGSYTRSLDVLKAIKDIDPNMVTKSGFMVGFGESMEDIHQLLNDLKRCDVDIITVGQYLQPSKHNIPVKKYYTDDEFKEIENLARQVGFKQVFCGKLVRSSYHAGEVYSVL